MPLDAALAPASRKVIELQGKKLRLAPYWHYLGSIDGGSYHGYHRFQGRTSKNAPLDSVMVSPKVLLDAECEVVRGGGVNGDAQIAHVIDVAH